MPDSTHFPLVHMPVPHDPVPDPVQQEYGFPAIVHERLLVVQDNPSEQDVPFGSGLVPTQTPF